MPSQPGIGCSTKSYGWSRRSRLTSAGPLLMVQQDRKLCLLTCCGLFYAKLVRWSVKIHPKCFYCKADWCVWLWVVPPRPPLYGSGRIYFDLVCMLKSLLILCTDFLTHSTAASWFWNLVIRWESPGLKTVFPKAGDGMADMTLPPKLPSNDNGQVAKQI